jgi:hypothetical protein
LAIDAGTAVDADLGWVLVIGDVADSVQAIPDAPVAAREAGQLGRPALDNRHENRFFRSGVSYPLDGQARG